MNNYNQINIYIYKYDLRYYIYYITYINVNSSYVLVFLHNITCTFIHLSHSFLFIIQSFQT